MDRRQVGQLVRGHGVQIGMAAGQGVFLAWDKLANDPISRGHLVAPFPEKRLSGLSCWFVTAKHAPRSKNVEAFRSWLKAELETTVGEN
ncbi:MAG: LysR substrate-binding domain-containing protein [Rhizobiaceae bacterium]